VRPLCPAVTGGVERVLSGAASSVQFRVGWMVRAGPRTLPTSAAGRPGSFQSAWPRLDDGDSAAALGRIDLPDRQSWSWSSDREGGRRRGAAGSEAGASQQAPGQRQGLAGRPAPPWLMAR